MTREEIFQIYTCTLYEVKNGSVALNKSLSIINCGNNNDIIIIIYAYT